MAERGIPNMTWEQARETLGVLPAATEVDVRAAYLAKVRLHPPDRDPEAFERIRDAYDLLRDPRRRARQVLECPSPLAPLTTLPDQFGARRRHVGPTPWLEALKERR